ncbi:MFS transporter [Pseudonocardia oroxyli]|uniref:MFS transporter, UMF1 family n=1 Tax=Pseudonocardia oroxyli TaxID=366584 RepID=A0A1G7DEH8_PSEOR|nr:MFS transporter [Pseudonocardia oroxyli]SDE49998.1 MFS transporter, UMF1 family [Pseudonocardia oroxyli]
MSIPRRQVAAWGLWDWGSSAYTTIFLTFVFSVYVTDAVGADLPGTVGAETWLAWAIGAAGFVIAVLAPVMGQAADRGGHVVRSTAVWTALTIVATALGFFVQDDWRWLWLGVLLLALGSVTFEIAEVSYNALLARVSTPATIGRVSGFGWSMGYFGGIVLLLLVYVLFIAGEGGALGLATENGWNIRVVALVAAAWFVLAAIPLFVLVPERPPVAPGERLSAAAAYRKLVRDLRELYRTSPHTVYFLGASALFRDGLAAVFTFGAVLAVTVYGIGAADVLIFGVAANVVSALGALSGGWLDDRIGPKPVIVGSLVGLLAAGTILLVVSGPTMFWIFGLFLCLFVGPAQSSSRTFLGRLCPPGHEGQLFGLYATTGRAVSFLAPTLFGVFALVSPKLGILGILVVLAAGLVALWRVRSPALV